MSGERERVGRVSGGRVSESGGRVRESEGESERE